MGNSVTFTGSSCQQNTQARINNSTIPTQLFPSKQTDPVPFLCYQGHKISSLQSHDHNSIMGLSVGGKRKIGGLATAVTGCETEDPIDKENIGGLLDGDVYEEQSKPIHSAGILKINLNKRRLSSVTECGEIEDMAEHGDKLTLALSWFRTNYYEHPTGSVSRSELYEKYTSMCMMMHSEPMNMATLGKHLRNLFPGIITRRLGNRGNSRYHYYGMAEIGVPIEEAPEGVSPQIPLRRKHRKDLAKTRKTSRKDDDSDYSDEDEPRPFRPIALRTALNPTMDFLQCPPNQLDYAEFLRLQQEICVYAVGEGPSEEFSRFAKDYQNHTADILQKLIERDFASIESLIQSYWTGLDEVTIDTVLEREEAIRLVSVADDYLYQVGICVLMPDAVEPCPLACLQSIRVFSKSFENWFTSTSSITGVPLIFGNHIQLPNRLVEVKIDLAKRFSLILRRRTSVNHLAQAMHSVVNNKAQVQQMIHDWDHIDFASIRDHTKWVFGSKEPFVSYIEVSVKSYLFEEAPLTMWTHWLENLIEQYIAVEMASGRTLDRAAKDLILGWSYYQTMVLRDLTLRSASSFGSFHILRLFVEEYVSYYVERKLDEHRRAVGVLGSWPTEAHFPTSAQSFENLPQQAYEDFMDDQKNGLQMMSSVADHHFPPSDSDQSKQQAIDRFKDLSMLLS